jgi:signal peptidase I
VAPVPAIQGSGEAPPPAAPASPWVAVTLSLFALGAGHVYAGRPLRGAKWFGAAALTVVVLGALARPLYLVLGLAGMWLIFLAPFAVYIAAARDAAKTAPKRSRKVSAWLVVASFVLCSIARAPVAMIVRAFFVEAFKIPSAGDLPTLVIGDHVFVDKLTPRRRAPRRGELITFPSPERPDQIFTQRVVALPGDTVQVIAGQLVINGWHVPRCHVGRLRYRDEGNSYDGSLWLEFLGDSSYLTLDDEAALFHDDARTWRAAPGEVFVMGDNRDNSYDSRIWFGGEGGGVPLRTVHGLALTVWLSTERGDEGGVNWTRVGADLTGRQPSPPTGMADDVARCLRERPAGTLGPP